jgi:hypothetical protein
MILSIDDMILPKGVLSRSDPEAVFFYAFALDLGLVGNFTFARPLVLIVQKEEGPEG